MNEVPPLRQGPPPKKRNWLLIGCLGTIAVVFLLIAAVVVGGWLWFRSLTNRYLADKPQPLPIVELSRNEALQLDGKLQQVYQAVQQNQPFELELNTAELNSALSQNGDLKDRVWLEIRDGKLRGKVSIPLDESGMKALQGRWLNGDATLNLTANSGNVRLSLQDLTVNGQSLPAQLLEGLREQNFIEGMTKEGEAAEYLQKVEAITFAGDKLRVRFKAGN